MDLADWGGLALISAGIAGPIALAPRLGRLAWLLPFPALWCVGAGLAQFPLFEIQRPWPAEMWLLVLLVPLAFALGAAGVALARRGPAEAAGGGPPSGPNRTLRGVLVAMTVIGLAELAHQFAGAGGVPLLSGDINATRFAQPQGPSVVLIDLLAVVAVVALTLPRRPLAPEARLELALGVIAVGGLALQASRGSLLLPIVTVMVARAMVWGLPRRRALVVGGLAVLVAFSGLFYVRVAQNPDGPFEKNLLEEVVPSRSPAERPFLPLYVALAPNFEVLRGLVEHFPSDEPFARGAFDAVAIDAIVPGTRLTGEVTRAISPPFTAPTFAGPLWADGGFALVWLGVAALGALNALLLTQTRRSAAYAWRLPAGYAVVLTAFSIYDNFFTQYVDWLIIGPALAVTGALADPAAVERVRARVGGSRRVPADV